LSGLIGISHTEKSKKGEMGTTGCKGLQPSQFLEAGEEL